MRRLSRKTVGFAVAHSPSVQASPWDHDRERHRGKEATHRTLGHFPARLIGLFARAASTRRFPLQWGRSWVRGDHKTHPRAGHNRQSQWQSVHATGGSGQHVVDALPRRGRAKCVVAQGSLTSIA